ncbi:MAG: hypothetical protein HOV94_00005, partial [Saccharothrix sp.]|nr:hypothetical protein [Saccharothrix sp.]
EPGTSGVRLLLLTTREPGLHFALVAEGASTASTAAARAELAAWVDATFR